MNPNQFPRTFLIGHQNIDVSALQCAVYCLCLFHTTSDADAVFDLRQLLQRHAGYAFIKRLIRLGVSTAVIELKRNISCHLIDGEAGISSATRERVLIMATEMLDEDIAHFSRLTVPYISIDHDFTTQNISTVAINNQMGTFQAIEYLVNMGHTDIGYVHTTEYISSWSERALGYRQALAQFRLPLSDDKVYRARYNGGNSYDDFCQVIASGAQLPTALVTDDDVIAVGVMRALQDAGYRVPEDISIVGFNNRPVCELVHPMLTSIDVPKQDFSTEAVDALVSLIQKQQRGELPKLAVKRRITTTLIERQSVCRIP